MTTPSPSPPSPPLPPPSPPRRPLPVGARLLPTDVEFVELTELVIEKVDLQHDLIKEKSAYIDHPAVLLESGKPAIEVKKQHLFVGSRKKQNGHTFCRAVGDIGYWKQAGSRAVIKNENADEVGWSANFDMYLYKGDGDTVGEHTGYRMTEYNSTKYPSSEKCVFTLVYWDSDYKAKCEGLDKAIEMFEKEKPKAVVNKKKAKGKVVRAEGDNSGYEEESQSVMRLTRSHSRQVNVKPLFPPMIPKKPRGQIGGKRFEAILEETFIKFLKARGSMEVGEASGVGQEDGDGPTPGVGVVSALISEEKEEGVSKEKEEGVSEEKEVIVVSDSKSEDGNGDVAGENGL